MSESAPEPVKDEPKPENEPKSDATAPEKPGVNPVIVGGGVALIAAILFVIFGMRSKPVSYDNPIPYIYNRNFLSELSSFASQQLHKEVLVFHGAGGVGKTRGLRQFMEQLNGDDRLAINFDFKMVSDLATPRDLMDYLESAVISGLQRLDGKQVRASELRNTLALTEAVTTVEGKLMRELQIPLKDGNLQRIARALVTIIEKIEEAPESSIRGLLEGIDSLAPLRPIVIVNDVEKLSECASEELVEFARVFVKVCDDFASDFRQMGVIFEVSDESALVDGFKLKAMRLRTVGEFLPEDAQSVLVNDNLFSKATFQSVKDKFGGNGRGYAAVHDLTREGLSVSGAFSLIEKQIRDDVLAAVGLHRERAEFLRKLEKQRVLPVADDLNTAKHLLKHKVITLTNSTHCCFAGKFVERAAQTVLQQIPK